MEKTGCGQAGRRGPLPTAAVDGDVSAHPTFELRMFQKHCSPRGQACCRFLLGWLVLHSPTYIKAWSRVLMCRAQPSIRSLRRRDKTQACGS